MIKGDAFGINIHDDVTGGIMETCLMDLGQDLGHDINIRKREGDATKAAFPRKPGDAVFSVALTG